MKRIVQSAFAEPAGTVRDAMVVHQRSDPAANERLIVLVHGLGGRRYGPGSTWQLLPRFLFEDFPDHDLALYSYRSLAQRLVFWRSIEPEQEARILADAIRDARGYRRVFLVAHSMGGLLCLGALRYLIESGQERVIEDRVAGLLLMGTPLLGSLRVPRLLTWFHADAALLAPHSAFIRRIHTTLAGRISLDPDVRVPGRITVPTWSLSGGPDRVVDPLSSTIGIPPWRTKTVHDDHVEMVKPESKQCDAYQWIESSIRDGAVTREPPARPPDEGADEDADEAVRRFESLPPDRKLDFYRSAGLAAAADEWFRPGDAFNFHPRDHFVPIFGQWGETTHVDLVEPVVRRVTAEPPCRIAVSANYGQGKTFFSWAVALRLAGDADAPLPLFYPLRMFSPQASQSPPAQIAMYLEHEALRGMDVERLLAERRCLLILDGLDELPAGTKPVAEILDAILASLRRFERLSILVTYRTGLFAGGTSELPVPLAQFEPVTLDLWSAGGAAWRELLRKCEESGYLQLPGGWESFDAQIRATPLVHLTERPLWCRMILEFRDRILGEQVTNEAELYEFYARQYLAETDTKSGAAHYLNADEKLTLMELLARELAGRNLQYVDDADIARAIHGQLAVDAGRLRDYLEREVRTYTLLHAFRLHHRMLFSFGHSSFLDFFFARAVVGMLERGLEGEALARALTILSSRKDAVHFAGQLLARRAKARRTVLDALQSGGDVEPAVLRGLLHVWIACERATSRSRLDLRGFRLDRAMLSGLDLQNADLEGASLVGAHLIGCDLRGARLLHAKCRGANFTNARTDSVDWTGADLEASVGRAAPPG